MTLSDHAQRQLDIESGRKIDLLAEARRRAAEADRRRARGAASMKREKTNDRKTTAQ